MGDAFGARVVAAGFILNNELTDFDFVPVKDGQPTANRVEAGKRPRGADPKDHSQTRPFDTLVSPGADWRKEMEYDLRPKW